MYKILLSSVVLFAIILAIGAYWFSRPTNHRQSLSLADFELAPVPQPSPPQTVKLLFGGDLMFDRHIRQRMDEHGVDFIFQQLQPIFSQYDGVIANLEGPVTNKPSRSVNSQVGSTNNFIFTFDPQVVPMLKRSNFQVVNLGNNHILNFGTEGVDQTKQYLKDNGILFFGDTTTESTSEERVVTLEIKNKKIGFVNYNEFVSNGYDHALADLEYIKDQADLIIVYTHWGAEYQPYANRVIQQQAHAFIDAGADLVIGSHPHVVQQSEDYQGKKIYYSLGNFVFDQYFSQETKSGLLIEMTISNSNTLHFSEIPIELLSTGQTRVSNLRN